MTISSPWFVSIALLGSLTLCGCPADDDGTDTAADTDAQPATGDATEADSGTSAPPATDSGDDALDATDAATDDAASGSGSDSGSGSGDGVDSGSETGGPTCDELACDGECIPADDCIGPAICVVPATEDCLACMSKSCMDVGGRDTAAVDVANTLGNCYDGEGDPLAACLEDTCNDACEGPFLRGCMCV